MNGNYIVKTLDIIFIWLIRFVTLNSLWILFTLRGLLLGGIFPATVASLGLTRKWILGQQDIKLYPTYKEIFQKEFARANILGWIFVVIGIILYLNYLAIKYLNKSGDLLFIFPFAFYLLVFFYLITVIWIFPLLAHYEAHLLQYIKNALIIGLIQLYYTFSMLLIVVLGIAVSLKFPGIMPFFTISITAYGVMWIAKQVLEKYDTKLV